MSSNSFKESWLIPKNSILDYYDYKSHRDKDLMTDDMEQEQSGGNLLLNNLQQYKPSRRLKNSRYYNRVYNMRNSPGQPVPPSLQPPAPVYNDPNTARNQINFAAVLQYFPEPEKYKVMSLLNYINQYLLYRFSVNRYLNIAIDKRNYPNSSIVDILKYLFAIERFYLTQHRIVVDPTTKQKFGIPLGTEEFVNMLKKSQSNLKVFGISGHRLRLLNDGVEPTESEDEDSDNEQQPISYTPGDGGDGGDGGGGDGNGGDAGGDNNQTPFRRPSSGRGRGRRLQYPAGTSSGFPEQQQDLLSNLPININQSILPDDFVLPPAIQRQMDLLKQSGLPPYVSSPASYPQPLPGSQLDITTSPAPTAPPAPPAPPPTPKRPRPISTSTPMQSTSSPPSFADLLRAAAKQRPPPLLPPPRTPPPQSRSPPQGSPPQDRTLPSAQDTVADTIVTPILADIIKTAAETAVQKPSKTPSPPSSPQGAIGGTDDFQPLDVALDRLFAAGPSDTDISTRRDSLFDTPSTRPRSPGSTPMHRSSSADRADQTLTIKRPRTSSGSFMDDTLTSSLLAKSLKDMNKTSAEEDEYDSDNSDDGAGAVASDTSPDLISPPHVRKNPRKTDFYQAGSTGKKKHKRKKKPKKN